MLEQFNALTPNAAFELRCIVLCGFATIIALTIIVCLYKGHKNDCHGVNK